MNGGAVSSITFMRDGSHMDGHFIQTVGQHRSGCVGGRKVGKWKYSQESTNILTDTVHLTEVNKT
jgi:hypothetical protein